MHGLPKRPARIALPFLLTLALALVCFAQAPQPESQWLDPDKTEPLGTRYATFPSRLAGSDASYLVYLPPDYATAAERRFPVVYWLHGLGGSQRTGANFVAHLDAAIRTGKAPAMIAILVNGMRDSMYCDSADGKLPVESVLVKELVPHVDRTWRTIAQREARAVEGYSMGGFGAAHLGFKYPDLFGVVGVMAGALHSAESIAAQRPQIFAKIFSSQADYFRANDPSLLAEHNADAIRGKCIVRIGVGDQDRLQTRNQALHELLGRLNIDHEYEVVPGVGHNGRLFYDTLGDRAFQFYQRALARYSSRPAPRYVPPAVPATSRVLSRGDLEILTFETEQEYDRLQELFWLGQNSQPSPGSLATQYFRSRMDGSVQPFAVWLPRQYSPAQRFALVVQLHGLNFNEVVAGGRTKYRGMQAGHWIDPNLPVIVAQAYGRPSMFYQGMGEEDVLEVVDEVRRRWSADPDRIFIMGHSMGGAGSYTVGLHYPDRFGGITPVDAAMGGRLAPPADLPAWMKPQVDIQLAPKLYPNARNLGVFFKHAGAGIQGSSTEYTDGIVSQGGFSTTESFPGLPHGFAQFRAYATFLPQLAEHPIRRDPPEIKFYTNTLRYNRAYWITIDRLTKHNVDAFLAASHEGGKDGAPPAVRISTTNIDALTVTVPPAAATVTIDGRQLAGPFPEPARFHKANGTWQAGQAPPKERSKRHGMQGPVGDAFNSRFLAVYPDADRQLAIAELDATRNPPGPLVNHGDFPMKAASKVIPADISSCNLILYGTPESNSVLKRIAGLLPARLLRYGDDGVRPVFIYPNPENPSRYVVVWSAAILSSPENGLRAGWVMPVNLLPDWVLVKEGKIVSGGHFDSDWGLSPVP